jgi:hypothetical protein
MEPHSINGTPQNGGQGPAIKLSGKRLAKWRKMGVITPDFAARLAYGLQVGRFAVGDFTDKQSRLLTGASRADLAAVRRSARRKHRQHRANGNGQHARVLYRRDPTDSDVDAIVAKIGADRVMKALDRHTQPQMFAAA